MREVRSNEQLDRSGNGDDGHAREDREQDLTDVPRASRGSVGDGQRRAEEDQQRHATTDREGAVDRPRSRHECERDEREREQRRGRRDARPASAPERVRNSCNRELCEHCPAQRPPDRDVQQWDVARGDRDADHEACDEHLQRTLELQVETLAQPGMHTEPKR
jgi:hypothetical protein